MVKFEAWRVQASVTHSLKGKPSRYQYRYNWYDITRSFRFEYGHNSYGNPFTSEIPNTHSEMHGDHGETPLRKCLLLAACFVPFLPKIGAFLGCTLLSQKGWPKCSLRTARPAFTLRPCFFHRHKWGSLVWPGRVASGNGNRPCQRLDLSIVWEERSTPEWEWRDIEYGSFWTYVIYVYIYIYPYISILLYIFEYIDIFLHTYIRCSIFIWCIHAFFYLYILIRDTSSLSGPEAWNQEMFLDPQLQKWRLLNLDFLRIYGQQYFNGHQIFVENALWRLGLRVGGSCFFDKTYGNSRCFFHVFIQCPKRMDAQ